MDCIAEGLKAVLSIRDTATMRGVYGNELFAKRTASGEMALSMKCATGWELILLIGADGAVKVQRVLFDCVAETFAAMLRDEAESEMQLAALRELIADDLIAHNSVEAPQACEAMPAPAAVQNVAQAAKAPRCAHFKAIKRAYAIAREAGLDVKADADMRAAFSGFLCKPVASRETLSGSDWKACGDAMKAGYLTW